MIYRVWGSRVLGFTSGFLPLQGFGFRAPGVWGLRLSGAWGSYALKAVAAGTFMLIQAQLRVRHSGLRV